MGFTQCILDRPIILMEGALGERLKREYGLVPEEEVALASLVYQEKGRLALESLWGEYIRIAADYDLPFLATTPTRRANRERSKRSGYGASIIADNAIFLKSIQKKSGIEMYVGGLMGCRGDAYTGEGALTEADAKNFHQWSADLFAESKVDFLYAGIMPTLPEAAGMARAMEQTGLPYIISFTIQGDGRLIDGTAIADAIAYIDGRVRRQPVCYMTNCVHPAIVYEALSKPWNQNDLVRSRFWGVQANTSPLPYDRLDGSTDLKNAEPRQLAEDMMKLRKISGIKIFGGCCGTDGRHMERIAAASVQSIH